MDLQESKVADAGLREILYFKALKRVDLDGTHVTPAGLRELRQARPELAVYPKPKE
jgi:hypothetical protein